MRNLNFVRGSLRSSSLKTLTFDDCTVFQTITKCVMGAMLSIFRRGSKTFVTDVPFDNANEVRRIYFIFGTPGSGREIYCNRLHLLPEYHYIVVDKLELGIDVSSINLLNSILNIISNSPKFEFLL